MAGIAALALAYVLSQFYRSFLAVLAPGLVADLGATKAELSFASGTWFIVFALMQFAVGVSLDRYGPRRTASYLLGVCGGGGALLFCLAGSPLEITIAMGLIGAGCAPVLMAPLFIFARTFSPARFAILASWFVALGSLGNVVGAAPLAAAAEFFGWREVMAGFAAFTLLVAVALFLLVRDPPQEDAGAGGTGLSGYLELLKLKVLWPIIPLMAINYAPPAGIRGLWAGPYLAEVYALDTLAIGNVTLFMALGMVAGSFLYGPLDTLLGTRKWVAAGGNAISLAAVTALAALPLAGVPFASVMLVIIGVAGMGYGMIMAHSRAFFPAHLTGRGVTLMNFFSIGGVGAMQFATGGVVSASVVPGEPVAAYAALFAFYALLLGAALVIYLFSRDAPPERS
ncbi:MAG: MFS transporter [Rhizobiaceae bacterium]|nr:MFS transporter [Rhizobiaceae bacterium]